MAGKLVLAIDQGTTGSTALVVDERLAIRGRSTREFRQTFPKPGWVEHEGSAIWESVESAVQGALHEAKVSPRELAGIGITNQRETTCLFEPGGKPLHNFIVWQDRRTAPTCQRLKDAGHEARVKQQTGLVLDPYFSGTKMQWLLEHVPGAQKKAESGAALFGTIDSWLVHKLTGGKVHVTDATNASRTLLMSLKTCAWDPELLALFGVPKAALPTIASSSELYGATAGLSFLPDGIPVCGIAGDQQAALFGQACFSAGEAKCTYGTGAFLLLHTGSAIVPSSHGLLTTVASKLGDEVSYALEGAAFIAGAAVQWLRDGLGLITKASEIEALARSVDDTGEVCFVPSLAGLGAPHWRPDARGVLCGFSRDTHKGHVARAVLEGIALQNVDILRAMVGDAGKLSVLKVDGGAAANDLLMQMQADLLDVPCVRPEVIETTALGAAALAGLAAGVFSSKDEVKRVWRENRTFRPTMSPADRERKLGVWARAVARA
ncbi:MAG: glycerol kinase GlpK [Deltaproteobacteria bacterium]|nr:glycerol kinase GlpK [Deltaproteobacteria bacterium]